MKRSLALLLVAGFLAGCGKSNQSNSPPNSSTPETPGVATVTNTRTLVAEAAGGAVTSSQPTVASATANATANQPQSAGAMLEGYGHTLAQARGKAQYKTSFISVNQAIQAYQVEHGKSPGSLDDIIKEGLLPRLPDLPKGKRYNYNPQTGELTIVDEKGVAVFGAGDLK